MKKIIWALVAFVSIGSSLSLAEDASHAYVGGHMGVGTFTSASAPSVFTYGMRGGYGIYATQHGILSLGLMTTSFSQSSTVGSILEQDSFHGITSEIISRKMLGTGLYLGGRFGFGLQSVLLTAGGSTFSGTTTRLLMGPVLGYEIPVGRYSITIDTSWMNAGSTTMSITGLGAINVPASQVLLFQAGVLYHF